MKCCQLVILLTCLLSPLFSSAEDLENWEFIDIADKANMQFYYPATEGDLRIIDCLSNKYRGKPYQDKYKNISFSRTYLALDGMSRYMIFDIDYVDDIYVVFQISKNGEIIDNFLISSW